MADKDKRLKAVVPEREPQVVTSEDIGKVEDILGEPKPEPDTEPSPGGKMLSSLEVGGTFHLGEKKYQLYQMFGEIAQVMLLNTVKNQVAPNEYVDAEVGVEFIKMPGDTIIE